MGEITWVALPVYSVVGHIKYLQSLHTVNVFFICKIPLLDLLHQIKAPGT